MTVKSEAEWLTSKDRGEMIQFVAFLDAMRPTITPGPGNVLNGRMCELYPPSARSVRLLAVRVGRQIFDVTNPNRQISGPYGASRTMSLMGLMVAEKLADGQVAEDERIRLHDQISRQAPDILRTAALAALTISNPGVQLEGLVRDVSTFAEMSGLVAYPHLIRCVIGNTFRKLPDLSRFRLPEVVRMATDAYEHRDFSYLPILADALEEAGCDDVRVLEHLRLPDFHARGCWAVDAILGKR
jgi:hypothetical protein